MVAVMKTTAEHNRVNLLTSDPLAELRRKQDYIISRVEGVALGYQPGLYLHGRPGTAKTYTVRKTLDDLACRTTTTEGISRPSDYSMYSPSTTTRRSSWTTCPRSSISLLPCNCCWLHLSGKTTANRG